MSESPDLALVDTADLVDELRSRHDGALIVLIRDETPDGSRVRHHYGGTAIMALGLARYAEQRLMHEILGPLED